MEIKHTRKDLGLISEDPDTGSPRPPRRKVARLHLLRKLRAFHVDPTIHLLYHILLRMFCPFCFIGWFYTLDTKQRNSLENSLNFSSKTAYIQARTLSLFRDQEIAHRVESVLRSPEDNACPVGGFRSLADTNNGRGSLFPL